MALSAWFFFFTVLLPLFISSISEFTDYLFFCQRFVHSENRLLNPEDGHSNFFYLIWVLKITPSLMKGTYGLCRQSSGLWGSLRDGDFEEEEVWAILRERTADSSFKFSASMEFPPPLPSSSSSVSGPHLSAAKIIPRPSSNDRNNKVKNLQNSAPVNTPQWPQIYGQKSKTSSWHDDDDDDGKDDDDNEGEDEKLPPHEYIARRLARSHISSFSVLEGVGRTLKGRDLSKVRNAILTKTGFLE